MIEKLLSRLSQVKKTGNDRWLACCPAHDDRKPSMNIKAADDGRVLVICRAGCSAESILDAVGLEFKDLFPERLGHHFPPTRKPFPAADVLEALATESMVVAISAQRLFHGEDFTVGDWQRLMTANQRISVAVDMTNG